MCGNAIRKRKLCLKLEMSRLLLIFFLLFSLSYHSQDLLYKTSSVGFNFGGNIAIGSHFQRMGLNFNFFYVNNFIQTNSEVRAYINFKNLGPKGQHPELVFSQGLVFAYGKKQNAFNPFINSVSNQTGYSSSVAYSYNVYLNKKRTSQVTGIIGLQFGSVSVITENDILAWPLLDRFRTGAFLIQYQYENLFQAAVNCTMWTGAMGKTTYGDTLFPAHCYIDTTGGRHTKYSHGLLSAQIKYHPGFSQIVQGNIGVDAEQVRNAVQNKFIHDACFIPKSWFKRYNCHIPMLDEKGNQFLNQPSQKIRKPKLYLNVYSNANLFY